MSTLLILTFSIFEVGSILDFVHVGFRPIQDFVHLGFCPIRDFVQSGILSVSGFCPIRDFVQFWDFFQSGFCPVRDFVQDSKFTITENEYDCNNKSIKMLFLTFAGQSFNILNDFHIW